MTLAVCTSNVSTMRARHFAELLEAPFLDVERHRYPDGESGVRILGPVPRRVIVFADLDRPDARLLPLVFLLDALRDLGAEDIVLVLPYLPYLRQDARFREGEAITSRSFAKIVSSFCDHVVTVDPHLHRYHALSEIYSIPDTVLSSADLIGQWVAEHLDRPLLVGPDSESEQWVKRAAAAAKAPFVILEKTRHGDRDVDIAGELQPGELVPVLVDDIISSGHTMAQTIRALRDKGARRPVCVGVHGLFADGARVLLEDAGAASIITCNTIEHGSNAIDVFPLIAGAIRKIIPKASRENPATS